MQFPGQMVQIDVKFVPEVCVERSHRKDNEYFYATHTFYSFEDFKKQLAVHSRKYNNFPMRPLNWKSPADYLFSFLSNGEVF